MSVSPVSAGEEQEPQTPQISESDGIEKEGDEEAVPQRDGFLKVTEVFYNWAIHLDPWQANPVKAVVHPNSLIHPDHPLREPGQDVFRLFNCLTHQGHERLCFSLKQIEYLQYYIHEMRLADPAWTKYLAKLSSANAEDQPKEGEIIEPPPYNEEENGWVPIPGGFVDADDVAEIEMIPITDYKDFKKILGKQKKHNSQVDRQLVDRSKLTSKQRSKIEAEEDNATSGPGLRRGPVKVHERRRSVKDREEGTGWGGFPTKAPGEVDEGAVKMEKSDPIEWDEKDKNPTTAREVKTDQEISSVPTSDAPHIAQIPSADKVNGVTDMVPESAAPLANGNADKAALDDAGKDAENEDDDEDVDPQPDLLAEQLNKLVGLRATLEAEQPKDLPEPTKPVVPEPPKPDTYIETYYKDAQQAFVLASAGGLASALDQKLAEAEETLGEGDEVPEVPVEIGRSLFFSLHLATWEEDENVVLEVGWAATWFQEKIAPEVEEKKDDKPKATKEEARFEQMTEHGHIIVQDHLLEKRNGKKKRDHRSSFGFGTSTPLPAKEVNATLKKKCFDLSKRAGRGPIYVLIHSTDADESEFKKVGWKTAGWEKQIRPAGWEFPSYASTEGVGNVFTIDTAMLFGAIEDDQTVQPAIGKTRRSLEAVAELMFGSDPDIAPKACANAGNHAAYCLQIFLGIVDGLPLEVLRADYEQSQVPIAVDPPTTDIDEKSDDETVRPSQSTPLQPTPVKSEPPITKSPSLDNKIAGSPLTSTQPEKESPAETERIVEIAQNGHIKVNGKAVEVEDEEEDEDEDAGLIRGVFWEDRSGNIVELSEKD